VFAEDHGGRGASGSWTTWYRGSTPWVLDGKSADGRTLYVLYKVYVDAGAAAIESPSTRLRDRLEAIHVTETANSVHLGLEQKIEGRGEVGVIEANVRVPIRLKQPLGRRRLRHAPTAPLLREDLAPQRGVPARHISGPGPGGSGPEPWQAER